MRAQSPNELSQLVSFLCPRAVTIISIPLARGRAAASTMHPANPPTPYCGARQRCPLRFDLAVQRGALWALSIGLTSSVAADSGSDGGHRTSPRDGPAMRFRLTYDSG